MTALVTVTLQIAYLPTLYAAFNRRETEIGLLNSRAGSPSWGPELLARTYYALGSGTSTLDTLPELYAQWERWASDVTESHVTYSPLIWFRSADPLASWVTALLAVLDSAALYLSLCPLAAPQVPARLCLRSGLMCFDQIARSMGIDVPEEPDVAAGISLTYEEYLEAIIRLGEMDFPIERDPAQAWPALRGLAGQLRAGRLRDSRHRGRGTRPVVRAPAARDAAHPAAAPDARADRLRGHQLGRWGYTAVKPPSTGMTAPWMLAASSLARKTAVAPIWAGVLYPRDGRVAISGSRKSR